MSPPLLLLHGFTGSGATWDDLCRELQPGLATLAPDLIGHGPPPAPKDLARYSMDACVTDLRALLDRPACVLGYSMGGRVALHLALAGPERVAALILESASPGIEDADERAARAAADEELATFIEQRGLEAFVDRWEQTPLLMLGPHVPESVRQRQRQQRLARDPRGLANSLRGMGAGRLAPVWHRLAELSMPVLLIVGERDTKYRAIAERMLSLLPNARLDVVPDAGHTVHLEQPAVFAELVRAQCSKLA